MSVSTVLDATTSLASAAVDVVAIEPVTIREATQVSAAIRHRIPAGWYPDREDPARRRWWNGASWTDFYAAAMVTSATEVPQTNSTPRHSAAAGPSPLPGAPTLTEPPSSRPPVPALVVVLLAGLTGANTALLSLLALAR